MPENEGHEDVRREARADQPNQQMIMLLGEILEELKAQTAVMPKPPVNPPPTR